MKRFLILAVSLAALLLPAMAVAGARQQTARQAPAPGPLGKYDPPLTVYVGRGGNPTDLYDNGYNVDRNEWTIEMEETLGIVLKNSWVTATTNYNQKLAASIATGDLPDIFGVNTQEQFLMLARGDQLADLSGAFSTYGSELLKRAFTMDSDQISQVTLNGQLLAVPRFNHRDDMPVVWIRKDWLDKLGLQEPRNLNDLKNIAKAFVERDPDGNGRNDTIGLYASKNLLDIDNFSLALFFFAYHAYPSAEQKGQAWLLDPSGSLVNGVIQPEVKTALAALREWQSEGLLSRDWVNQESPAELLYNGQCGIVLGMNWLPVVALQLETMQPGAVLHAYPWLSADNEPAMAIRSGSPISYFVSNRKFANPEAVIKIANYMFEFFNGDQKIPIKKPYLFNSPETGRENWTKSIYGGGYLPSFQLADHRALVEAFKTGDTSKLSVLAEKNYPYIRKWYAGDKSDPLNWQFTAIYGPDTWSAFGAIASMFDNDQILPAAYTGPATETMRTRQGSLDALRDEVFTKIIIGDLPLSAFDTFVADWKRQGGDDITREVNAWYRENRQ
ncbi:MAG: extracellular solute-binding protein [Treponema sp.]|jgi:putative aldouronate transport system substrate-binding protein|nr:extracellular solute-binding protein [Treponema sp.]